MQEVLGPFSQHSRRPQRLQTIQCSRFQFLLQGFEMFGEREVFVRETPSKEPEKLQGGNWHKLCLWPQKQSAAAMSNVCSFGALSTWTVSFTPEAEKFINQPYIGNVTRRLSDAKLSADHRLATSNVLITSHSWKAQTGLWLLACGALLVVAWVQSLEADVEQSLSFVGPLIIGQSSLFPALEKYKVLESNPPCGCLNGVCGTLYGGKGFSAVPCPSLGNAFMFHASFQTWPCHALTPHQVSPPRLGPATF